MRAALLVTTTIAAPLLVPFAYAQNCQAPAQATAAGYTQQTFGAAPILGNNLYNMGWYGYNPAAVASVQNADGNVNLNGNASNPGLGNMLSSMSPSGQGVAFGGGGYFEATLSISGTNVNTGGSMQGGGGWPSWWANTYEALTGQNTMLGQVETDFMEMFVGNAYGGALHTWYNQDGSQVATNSPAFTLPAGTDVTQPHKYGFLWVPATGESQGYADFYFDRQVIPSMHTSWNQYQPGQTAQQNPYAILDTQHQVLFLGTGENNNMTIHDISVWQNAITANNLGSYPGGAAGGGGSGACARGPLVAPANRGGGTTQSPPMLTEEQLRTLAAQGTDVQIDINGPTTHLTFAGPIAGEATGSIITMPPDAGTFAPTPVAPLVFDAGNYPVFAGIMPPQIIPTIGGAGAGATRVSLTGTAPGTMTSPPVVLDPSATAQLQTLAQQPYGTTAINTADALGINPASIAAIAQAESEFQNIPTADGSTSATGPWQFTQGTFNDVSANNNLGLAPSSLADPNAQAVAAPYYLQQIASTVSEATGSPATTLQAYGAWVFGPTPGATIANATDSTPLSTIVSAQSLANNGMTSWTVGDFRTTETAKLGAAANQAVLSPPTQTAAK